jgi:hypothetical protein
MRYLLAIFLTASASASVINTNDMMPRSSYPTKIGGTYNPTIEMLREAGWREFVPCPGVDGSNIVATSYSDDGDTVTASCEYAAIPAITPLPSQFPEGIEVPWITVLSTTNQTGWLYAALDDGTLTPVLAHSSPWPTQAELDAKIKAATDKARTNKATAKAGVNGQLQQRITNIERLLGIRE